jgi:thiamine-phosphate pyrophosphorylase
MLRYAITDRTRLAKDEWARQSGLLEQAARLAALKVDYLQLREKDLPADDLATLARAILATLRDSPTKLLINSRADIALAVRAHGVHLTSAPGELTPAQVRALYAHASLPAPTVSLSCHTLEEATNAANSHEEVRPNLILFGPVFEKAGANTTPGTGLDLLTAACRAAAPIPVLALGGITEQNTPSCLAAGAAGIAAIRLFAPEAMTR